MSPVRCGKASHLSGAFVAVEAAKQETFLLVGKNEEFWIEENSSKR